MAESFSPSLPFPAIRLSFLLGSLVRPSWSRCVQFSSILRAPGISRVSPLFPACNGDGRFQEFELRWFEWRSGMGSGGRRTALRLPQDGEFHGSGGAHSPRVRLRPHRRFLGTLEGCKRITQTISAWFRVFFSLSCLYFSLSSLVSAVFSSPWSGSLHRCGNSASSSLPTTVPICAAPVLCKKDSLTCRLPCLVFTCLSKILDRDAGLQIPAEAEVLQCPMRGRRRPKSCAQGGNSVWRRKAGEFQDRLCMQ